MNALTDYTEKPDHKVSLKTALKRMRSLWYRGPVDRFDERLASILSCSLEEAERIRETWLSMGFLAYDRKMLLCWRVGGGF